jgi:hypothetical protein
MMGQRSTLINCAGVLDAVVWNPWHFSRFDRHKSLDNLETSHGGPNFWRGRIVAWPA